MRNKMLKKYNSEIIIEISREQHYEHRRDFTSLIRVELNFEGHTPHK